MFTGIDRTLGHCLAVTGENRGTGRKFCGPGQFFVQLEAREKQAVLPGDSVGAECELQRLFDRPESQGFDRDWNFGVGFIAFRFVSLDGLEGCDCFRLFVPGREPVQRYALL